jgi:hypothetical protein
MQAKRRIGGCTRATDPAIIRGRDNGIRAHLEDVSAVGRNGR